LAGVPPQDSITTCPHTLGSSIANSSCYYWNKTLDDYASHKLACEKKGGYLVSWNRCAVRC
jgi:hypothetical protein